MNKTEFLEWYGEDSDVFIDGVNKILDALKLSVDAQVGFEMNSADAKKLLTYISMIEQYIHTHG